MYIDFLWKSKQSHLPLPLPVIHILTPVKQTKNPQCPFVFALFSLLFSLPRLLLGWLFTCVLLGADAPILVLTAVTQEPAEDQHPWLAEHKPLTKGNKFNQCQLLRCEVCRLTSQATGATKQVSPEPLTLLQQKHLQCLDGSWGLHPFRRFAVSILSINMFLTNAVFSFPNKLMFLSRIIVWI